MQFFATDHLLLPLPEGHRFPVAKYRRLREAVERWALPAGHAVHLAPAATDEQLQRVHSDEYLAKVMTGGLTRAEELRLGFPWSLALVERSRCSSGATVAAAMAAMDEGCGVNLAGGTHHASREVAEGYCLFNDSVVAARELQARGASRVMVVDADVHQGNGTAKLVAEDASIFAYSIHCERNYPFPKERSDLDVGLPAGTGDDGYLTAFEEGLRRSWEAFRPEFVIYLAGADPYEQDRLGRLRLTKAGLLARDELVLRRCRERGIPVAIAMAGGYSPNIDDIVEIHDQTLRLAANVFG